MGSYNYLGFAENQGPRIESILTDIPKNGVGLASSPNELGRLRYHTCVVGSYSLHLDLCLMIEPIVN